jgi:chitinase
VNPLIVSIASPAEGASFVEGTQVTIKAEANDSRTVTKVVFQDNGNPIPGCEDVSAPYECSFTPTAGSHALSAVASDNRGGTATSTAVNITVKANVLPTVSISNPSTGAKMMQGEAITITVTASDTDGVVQQVEFLANNQVICTDTAPPFECLYQPADSGDVQLTARATDDRGGSSISGMITLQVSPKIPPPGEQRVFLPLVTRQ